MTDGKQPRKAEADRIALWIAIGLAIGAGVGVALGNVAIGVGLGISLGVAIGLAESARRPGIGPGGPPTSLWGKMASCPASCLRVSACHHTVAVAKSRS
jgi:hypothetical protein